MTLTQDDTVRSGLNRSGLAPEWCGRAMYPHIVRQAGRR